MTSYRYKVDVGEAGAEEFVERDFPFRGAPTEIVLEDGRTAKRSYVAAVPPTSGWPITCYASGVNAAQAQELRDEFDRVGVPTEVTSDGDPVYRNARHRKKALKARGFFDRVAYY